MVVFCFFFNDTATTEIYTLSLHDALPIWSPSGSAAPRRAAHRSRPAAHKTAAGCWLPDRKSTRLNSSHMSISYAVFCLKKKTDHRSRWLGDNGHTNRTREGD